MGFGLRRYHSGQKIGQATEFDIGALGQMTDSQEGLFDARYHHEWLFFLVLSLYSFVVCLLRPICWGFGDLGLLGYCCTFLLVYPGLSVLRLVVLDFSLLQLFLVQFRRGFFHSLKALPHSSETAVVR